MMTTAHRRYVAIEALIGAAISAVLSIVFVLLLFGGLDRVPTRALIGDALAQGFFVGLMATLVPTLLTRRRLARGAVMPAAAPPTRWPSRLPPRALLAGIASALLGVALTALLPLAGIVDLSLATVLVAKALWGFMVGGIVATMMTRIALAGG